MSGPDSQYDAPPSYESAVNDNADRSNSTAESRNEGGSQVYTHTLRIAPNTRRSELVYPTEWASTHDVAARDWTTFVARLFSGASEGGSEKRMSEERVRHIEGVIAAWNRDFFQPRNVIIRWEGEARGDGASGQSSTASPANAGSSSQSHPSPHGHYQHPPPRPSQQSQPQPASSQLPSRSSLSTKQRIANKIKNAAKERDVSLSSSKIRVGDVFSLDAHTGNVKIGKLSLSDKGMNYDGRPIGPPMPPHGYAYRPPHPYGAPYGNGRGYPPPQGNYHHGPGGPSQYPGAGYGPPRHTGSWGPPIPPRPEGYGPPPHAQTWHSPAQPTYAPPSESHGYGPPPNRGSWGSYGAYQNSQSQGQSSSDYQGQTSGTTW